MRAAPPLSSIVKIAADLKVRRAAIENVVAALKLQPTARKGAIGYYTAADVAKIKKALGLG